MITVVGSLNMDLVINTERIPRPGETVMGNDFKQIPGGKGANQGDCIAKLGAKVNMIGCVGQDSMGKFLKDSLKRDGVNVQGIMEKPHVPTGVASIIVESSGNNSITVAPGANYSLNLEDIKTFKEIIQKSDILLTQLETKLDVVKESLKIAKSAGKTTILNPAPAMKLDNDILENIDILTPNETELEVLSGIKTDTMENVELAGQRLIALGIKEIIVTLGSKGCVHLKKGQYRHYPAYKVKAIDTTAAGDSFNGALAVALNSGKTMEEAIEFANEVGAMTVTKEGAQTSLPLLEEVENFDQWYKHQQS